MNRILCAVSAAALLFGAAACGDAVRTTRSGLDPERFRTEIGGKPVAHYTLTNDAGTEVCITNFGGRVVSILVPDRDGAMRDVVLGFDNIDDYRTIPSDFGAAIGRYANRIGQGRFELDGTAYQLPRNNYGHCLHGGPDGWQYRVYDVAEATPSSLTLVLLSPDGDAGFPGSVTARVKYTLTGDNALQIDYEAETDAPTIVNMTNHTYFCLSGDPAAGSLDDVLQIAASHYTPVDSTFMTTGEIVPVEGTPMDFRTPKRVGEEIDDFAFEQLRNGRGYDHNWVLDTAGDATRRAARLYSPASGIGVEVYTNEPGIQVYAGNFLDGTVRGKGGVAYPARASVCLETQHYPDTPNKPQWPSAVLRPGERYTSHCTFRFTAGE